MNFTVQTARAFADRHARRRDVELHRTNDLRVDSNHHVNIYSSCFLNNKTKVSFLPVFLNYFLLASMLI